MSCSFGKNIRCTIFGQSHGEALGVIIDGLPSGIAIDQKSILKFMARRAPGKAPYATPRKEKDQPQIVSGIFEGKTCGAPLCAIIENSDTRSQDYGKIKDFPRPGHADFTARIKYQGYEDFRGGGNFSGRLTAPLVFAGGLCKDILREKGITIGAHIAAIGAIEDDRFDPVNVTSQDLIEVSEKTFSVLNEEKGQEMTEEILATKKDGDSLGGIIEGCVLGLPAGLGDPNFDGLENRLAATVFGIPAIKGVEFGAGFAAATHRGSNHNDNFYWQGGTVKTRTNHHGGILGGISTGMPLIMRVALKPTPSIGIPQETVNMATGEKATITVEGRHDPVIVPRAVPCLEAVMSIVILDFMLGMPQYL